MPAHATARLSRESSINGLLQVIESQSRVNSFMGGAAHARARVSPAVAAPVSAAPALFPLSSLGRALVSSGAAVADAHATTFTLHGASNSWSDTVRVQGPTRRKRSKGVFQSARCVGRAPPTGLCWMSNGASAWPRKPANTKLTQQAILEALGSMGLSLELMQQLRNTLAPPTPPPREACETVAGSSIQA